MSDIVYIEPKQIEKSLAALREKNRSANIIHASLFNLVIYAKKDQREEYLQKIMRNIVKKYPCRIILITEHDEGDFLRTYVSEIKPFENEKTPVFCEIINFEVAGSFVDRMPFVILPHILSDRPVYLLWGDDPAKKNPISSSLENFSTRTVFDSEMSAHMSEFSKTLLNLNESLKCDIGDLNWARCASWRSLLAQSFNSKERLLSLRKTKQIQIYYSTSTTRQFLHNKIQATYLQAWLASQLKWNFDTVLGTKEELSFRYQSVYGSVQIDLIPDKRENVTAGHITKIDIFSRENERILFERDRQYTDKVVIQRSTSFICEMPVSHIFDKASAGKSLISEIYSQGTSQSFLNALKLISRCQRGIISS